MNRRAFLQMAGSVSALGLLPGVPAAAGGAEASEARLAPRFGDGRDWWFQRRFGLFVHWGLYAIDGWHEQDQWRRRIPRQEYVKLARRWNPCKFEPDAWLDLAEAAGMGYICLTAKHHDGFCLFASKQTDYHSVNTPYGKDVVRLLADACHRRGFPLCLYYSIADWHHPAYPNQGRHHELPPQPCDTPDLKVYTEYVRAQIRELCTQYGEIHGIWWDMNVDKLHDPSFSAMIRELQPKAVINDRGYDAGDFGTPERDYTKDGEALASFVKRTEACQAVGTESWGYRADEDYYADRHLIRSIDKYLARDANYLLNVGPKPDGTICKESADILRRIGEWYLPVRESFDQVVPASDLSKNRDVMLTRRGNALYVHLNRDAVADAIKLPPIDVLPLRATLLNTGKQLVCSTDLTPRDHVEQKSFLRVRGIPVNELANSVPVIKLEFDKLPEAAAASLGDADDVKRR